MSNVLVSPFAAESAEQDDFSAAWARAILAHGRLQQMQFDELCLEHKVSEAVLANPNGRVPNAFVSALWEHALLDADPVEFAIGATKQIGMFDFGGYLSAIASCSTVRDATRLLERYLPLLSRAITVDVVIDSSTFLLRLRNNPNVHWANQLVFFALLAQTSQQLLRRPAIIHALMMNCDDPETDGRLDALFGTTVLFNSAYSGLILDTKDLDSAREGFNQAIHQSQIEIAEQALADLTSGFRLKVKDVIASMLSADEVIDAVRVAEKLYTSRRSLQRKLSDEGTSVSAIVDEVRAIRAKKLLITTKQPIELVAQSVGFQTQSSFTKFFSRCVGTTPLQYRKAQGAIAA